MGDSNETVSKQSQSSTPLSSELNSMSDYQLKKLTRSNTRKNVGGKKNRFLSQLERVCRRLELLSVTPQVDPDTQNRSLDAIPIVNPDGSTFTSLSDNEELAMQIKQNNFQQEQQQQKPESDQLRMPRRAQTPRFSKDTPFASKPETQNSEDSVSPAASTEDDDFDIEPATVDSTHDISTSATLTTKSFRSVRISTEVTILDYSPQCKRGQPMSLSVSTLRRTEHPTRNGRPFHIQRLANDNRFPRVMNTLDKSKRLKDIERLSRDGANSRPPGALGTNECDTSSASRSNPIPLRFVKESPRRVQSRAENRVAGDAEKPSDAREKKE